jgi:hypothetical protein
MNRTFKAAVAAIEGFAEVGAEEFRQYEAFVNPAMSSPRARGCRTVSSLTRFTGNRNAKPSPAISQL